MFIKWFYDFHWGYIGFNPLNKTQNDPDMSVWVGCYVILGINLRDILKPSKVGDVKIPSVSLCQADDEGSQQEEGAEYWQVEVRQELSEATEAGALLPPQRWRHSGSLALHRKYNEISQVQTQILDPN